MEIIEEEELRMNEYLEEEEGEEDGAKQDFI